MLKEKIPKILVVNDDASSLMALCGLLSSWEQEIPSEIVMANSGEEALRQVLHHEFALILLDVNMPGMNGFETAEAIHARPRSALIPIIFVTAYHADEMNRFKGYQKGAVDYLFTPVIPEILKAKLSVFVGLAKKNIELEFHAQSLDKRGKELAAINTRLEFEMSERKAAEKLNRTKDEFLAMLGHELRNPLSAISSAVAIMDLAGVNEDGVQRAKGVLKRQSQHLSRIVDDLLDLSRVMSGKIVLNKRPLNLAPLVESCVETMALAGRTTDYTIETHIESAWINGDPTRLEQVITNLLDNALKYTPSGGKIGIDLRVKDDIVQLEFCDSGVGISADLLMQVFDIFVQGERSAERAQGGLGIGLSLVRQLVELHEGTITAKSEGHGKGSTFVLWLPRNTEVDDAQKMPATPALRKALNVLLIEDNEDARDMMAKLLEYFGHHVSEAGDGTQGIQMAVHSKPDIIVIDIGLPGIDGHDVARHLKADPATSDIPLIALTGYGLEEDRTRAINAGFDRHLVKPVDTNGLIAAIDSCLPHLMKV